jgi:hypothetical protein
MLARPRQPIHSEAVLEAERRRRLSSSDLTLGGEEENGDPLDAAGQVEPGDEIDVAENAVGGSEGSGSGGAC